VAKPCSEKSGSLSKLPGGKHATAPLLELVLEELDELLLDVLVELELPLDVLVEVDELVLVDELELLLDEFAGGLEPELPPPQAVNNSDKTVRNNNDDLIFSMILTIPNA
jgi:hypothetical protein